MGGEGGIEGDSSFRLGLPFSFRAVFSEARRWFWTLRRSFSCWSNFFSASRALSASSMSSIRARFLSRAFWAATRFFSFLRISFSSVDRWSRLALFRAGAEFASDSDVDSCLISVFILMGDAGRFRLMLLPLRMLLGATRRMGFLLLLLPLPRVLMPAWVRRLWGMTMICWGCVVTTFPVRCCCTTTSTILYYYACDL